MSFFAPDGPAAGDQRISRAEQATPLLATINEGLRQATRQMLEHPVNFSNVIIVPLPGVERERLENLLSYGRDHVMNAVTELLPPGNRVTITTTVHSYVVAIIHWKNTAPLRAAAGEAIAQVVHAYHDAGVSCIGLVRGISWLFLYSQDFDDADALLRAELVRRLPPEISSSLVVDIPLVYWTSHQAYSRERVLRAKERQRRAVHTSAEKVVLFSRFERKLTFYGFSGTPATLEFIVASPKSPNHGLVICNTPYMPSHLLRMLSARNITGHAVVNDDGKPCVILDGVGRVLKHDEDSLTEEVESLVEKVVRGGRCIQIVNSTFSEMATTVITRDVLDNAKRKFIERSRDGLEAVDIPRDYPQLLEHIHAFIQRGQWILVVLDNLNKPDIEWAIAQATRVPPDVRRIISSFLVRNSMQFEEEEEVLDDAMEEAAPPVADGGGDAPPMEEQ